MIKQKKLLKLSRIALIMLVLTSIVFAVVEGAIVRDDYSEREISKLTFTETLKPESYDYYFNVGNKYYGINVDSSSDLWIKDDDGNILALDKRAVEQTLLYSLYQDNQNLKLKIAELDNKVNILCSASPLLC